MPFDPQRNALNDIKRNIDLARSFVADMSLATFRADQRTVYAVTRCLEIISEASRKLPAELKTRYPTIPWPQIAGAGNVYRHDYDDVSVAIVGIRSKATWRLWRVRSNRNSLASSSVYG